MCLVGYLGASSHTTLAYLPRQGSLPWDSVLLGVVTCHGTMYEVRGWHQQRWATGHDVGRDANTTYLRNGVPRYLRDAHMGSKIDSDGGAGSNKSLLAAGAKAASHSSPPQRVVVRVEG